MKHIICACIALLAVLVFGCHTPVRHQQLSASKNESDLDLNGLLPIWTIDQAPAHAGTGAFPSEVLAKVNSKLEERLWELTHDNLTLCVAYPTYFGCRVQLFLKVRSKTVEGAMSEYARKLLDEAYRDGAEWNRKYRNERQKG